MRPDELVGNADLALYRAKRDDKGSYRFFDRGLDRVMVNRREIGSALRRALSAHEFCNFYQPQYDLSTGDLVGYEALLRWNDPQQGLRMPGEFIPVAEETGLIGELGEWALIQACLDAAKWPEQLNVAVNLSPIQLKQSDIRQKIERALSHSGLRPDRLEIEVTENILISDTERALGLLKALQQLGVRIAMDDFGTGYSSLSYLARFPFDKIKVDRSFVSNLGHDQHVDAIITTIMGLGRSFNVPITAEGIETEAQLERLRAVGCQYGQGYLFGKPQPLDALPAPASIS
jgi:EAL domain-containing protein (putative c-di-GMP-specific phosphodiesterase class I)